MSTQFYTVRNIDGQDVFVKQINECFWLFNDVIVCTKTFHSFTDAEIMQLLDMKNDEFMPYSGSDKGFVLLVDEDNDTISEFHFSDYSNQNVIRKVKESLNVYRAWAGV